MRAGRRLPFCFIFVWPFLVQSRILHNSFYAHQLGFDFCRLTDELIECLEVIKFQN
jgi:hypothetical protein